MRSCGGCSLGKFPIYLRSAIGCKRSTAHVAVKLHSHGKSLASWQSCVQGSLDYMQANYLVSGTTRPVLGEQKLYEGRFKLLLCYSYYSKNRNTMAIVQDDSNYDKSRAYEPFPELESPPLRQDGLRHQSSNAGYLARVTQIQGYRQSLSHTNLCAFATH